MPFGISTFQLPCGARCVRVDTSGAISKADAEALIEQLGPGAPLHKLPILALTQGMSSMEPDARGYIAERREITAQLGWSGVVVTNPLVRVTLNFIRRLNTKSKQRLFATEAEAIRWLDERARKGGEQAKTGAP